MPFNQYLHFRNTEAFSFHERTLLVDSTDVLHAPGQEGIDALQILAACLLAHKGLPNHARKIEAEVFLRSGQATHIATDVVITDMFCINFRFLCGRRTALDNSLDSYLGILPRYTQ